MGTKRFLTASILSIAIAIPTIAQFNIDDDVSDFGLWTSVGLEKKLTKNGVRNLKGSYAPPMHSTKCQDTLLEYQQAIKSAHG